MTRRPTTPVSRTRAASDSFGGRFREARLKAGITQVAVSAATGVDRTHLGNIEMGRANPSEPVMRALAAAIGLELQILLAPPTTTPKRK